MTLTSLLGIERPIVQAPMAGVQLSVLRAATAKPFNVNVFCHAEPPRDAVREAVWRATLSRYYLAAGRRGASSTA